jgi:hypothetical protein
VKSACVLKINSATCFMALTGCMSCISLQQLLHFIHCMKHSKVPVTLSTPGHEQVL